MKDIHIEVSHGSWSSAPCLSILGVVVREPENPPQIAPDRVTSEASIPIAAYFVTSRKASIEPLPFHYQNNTPLVPPPHSLQSNTISLAPVMLPFFRTLGTSTPPIDWDWLRNPYLEFGVLHSFQSGKAIFLNRHQRCGIFSNITGSYEWIV